MNLLVKGRFNFMNFDFFLSDIVNDELVFAVGNYESKLLIKNDFVYKSKVYVFLCPMALSILVYQRGVNTHWFVSRWIVHIKGFARVHFD